MIALVCVCGPGGGGSGWLVGGVCVRVEEWMAEKAWFLVGQTFMIELYAVAS